RWPRDWSSDVCSSDLSLYTTADRAQAEEIEAEARKLDAAAETLRKELLEKVFVKELVKLPEEIRETVKIARNTPRAKRTPEQIRSEERRVGKERRDRG